MVSPIQFKNNPRTYGAVHMLLHWSIAFAVIAMLAIGLYMTRQTPTPDIVKLYGIHKALGILVLGAMVLRVIWRLTSFQPPFADGMTKIEKRIANLNYMAMYLLLLTLPITGWAMSSAAGFSVSVFGWFTMPDFVAPNKDLLHLFEEIHEYCAYTLLGLVVLHTLAALYHHFVRKDRTLKRMLP